MNIGSGLSKRQAMNSVLKALQNQVLCEPRCGRKWKCKILWFTPRRLWFLFDIATGALLRACCRTELFLWAWH